MFDPIARRYDLLNRLMSLGIDQAWRRATVKALKLGDEAYVLDLATGTGDLAIAIARAHSQVRVLGLDASPRMLEIALNKVTQAKLRNRIALTRGDALDLEFKNASFDAVCMAFGIRNMSDRARALREICRVTKPRGRVAILELAEPRGSPLSSVARWYVHSVVPRLGAWLSGGGEYRYLQQSIEAFPPALEFAEMMRDAGLNPVQIERLTLGACHLYVAERSVAPS